MRLVLLEDRVLGEQAWWRIRIKASGEVETHRSVVAAAIVRAGTGELVDDEDRTAKNAILNVREIRSRGPQDPGETCIRTAAQAKAAVEAKFGGPEGLQDAQP